MEANIEIIKSFKELQRRFPDIHFNVFYSEEYANSLNKSRFTVNIVYLVSNRYIIPVCLYKWFIFCYAQIVSDPTEYSDNKNLKDFYDNCLIVLKKELNVQWIVPSLAAFPQPDYPTNSERIKFGTYIVDLTQSDEVIMSKIHSKHRNVIKKASQTVVVKFGGLDLLDDYLLLDKSTWEKSHRDSYGNVFFSNILNNLKNNVFIAIAYDNQIPQSGAVIYFDSISGYYMYGANQKNPTTGAGNLLQLEIMRKLKGQGALIYNFVGCRINEDANSKYHGIQRFKARFGGELKEGYLFKSILNTHYYSFWCLLMRLTGRTVTDVINQEIHKWKEINN